MGAMLEAFSVERMPPSSDQLTQVGRCQRAQSMLYCTNNQGGKRQSNRRRECGGFVLEIELPYLGQQSERRTDQCLDQYLHAITGL